MLRRYNRWHSRFDQPDPFGGSYSLTDPQTFNRYAYVSNDPVSFTDPTGLEEEPWDPGESIRINTSVRGLFGAGGGGIRGNPDPEFGVITGVELFDIGALVRQNPTPAQNNDPCAGKKGQLNHFPNNPNHGIPHITPRHIEQTPEFKNKSRYTFSPLESGSLTSKQTAVMNLNQQTFEQGTAYRQGKRTAYVLAFPDFDYTVQGLSGPIGVRGFQDIGIDNLRGGKVTNVNTVIVGPDCSSVVTSFPGLPGSVSPIDPRITGTPHWWDQGRGYTWRR